MSMQLIPGKPINNPAVSFFIKQIHPQRIMPSLLPSAENDRTTASIDILALVLTYI